ncbi:MAG TPA: 23S rRNA (guanosine(2251)-2'-O)-methyltransferase RlmB [Haloplasmataceae bacterium]
MVEWIYGKNPIMEALSSGHPIYGLYVTERVFNQETRIMTLAQERNIPITITERSDLDRLVSGTHQGIVAKVAPYRYYQLSDVFEESAKRGEPPFFFILDGLEDPHNLGAILRTAEASGVHGVIIPKHRSVKLNATVAKLSAGAIHYVKVVQVTNIRQTIETLKKQGVWVVGTDLDTDADYTAFDYTMPIAIVIGNEGKGMSRLVRASCDALVKIPMLGKIQSLNASVTAAILMYEVVRQRHK